MKQVKQVRGGGGGPGWWGFGVQGPVVGYGGPAVGFGGLEMGVGVPGVGIRGQWVGASWGAVSALRILGPLAYLAHFRIHS